MQNGDAFGRRKRRYRHIWQKIHRVHWSDTIGRKSRHRRGSTVNVEERAEQLQKRRAIEVGRMREKMIDNE